MPAQQGFGFGYPTHYAQAPAAPHSLSPVAMNSVRNANATGPQRAQPTVVIRSRPSMKMGVSILVAGTLLGAVFGIGMRARQNAADAAFAAQQEPLQEQPQVAVALPPPQAPVAPVVLSPTPSVVPQGPTALPPNAYAGVPFGSLVVSPPAQQAPVAHAPAPAPQPAAAPKPAPQKHAAWWGKPAAGGHPSLSAKVSQPSKADKDKDDGYRVASAGNDDPPPKASKPAKEPVAAKDEPKEPKKAEPRAPKASRGGSDEADKVLKAAMGATENTL